MLTSIQKSKLCQASSRQLSKWPHNVQQGEKTGLGSGWGEEGPNFQSTSHLAFFLGPFSYQNIEESQNIYSEFSWRQKWLKRWSACAVHMENFWPHGCFGHLGTGRKMVMYIYFGLLSWYIFRRSRAMRRLTIGPRSARLRNKSPLWESMESKMGAGLVLCLFGTVTVKPPHLKQRQRSHLFVSKMASEPVRARERMKWVLLEIWKGSRSV